MNKFDINILDTSVWVTATPVSTDISMPFYIVEIGHFYTGENYVTDRSGHNSHMLIYTVKGRGYLSTEGFSGEINEREGVVFDCRNPHYYRSCGDGWEFYWIHIKGIGVQGISNALNHGGIRVTEVKDSRNFCEMIQGMIDTAENNDIRTLSNISSGIHALLNTMLQDSYDTGRYTDGAHMSEIRQAVRYIEKNYTEQINIDDIIDRIHISKYYFIRLFKQHMGMTPYSYLINYRINRSKILLRTESISVSEIAGKTGFADVSNFINQFKKQTGQKPMEYRRSFAYL